MLFVGPPGVGKSHLCQAIGLQAIHQGHTVYYRSIFDVVRDFLKAENLGEDEKVLGRYLKPELLIIDHMGMKQLAKRSGGYLFEIIMTRHQNRSTLMTSNRPIEQWGNPLQLDFDVLRSRRLSVPSAAGEAMERRKRDRTVRGTAKSDLNRMSPHGCESRRRCRALVPRCASESRGCLGSRTTVTDCPVFRLS